MDVPLEVLRDCWRDVLTARGIDAATLADRKELLEKVFATGVTAPVRPT